MIVDTSGLLAFFHPADPAHERVRAILDSTDDPLVVSPFVVAELDYLLATRYGPAAELAALTELASGAYELAAVSASDLLECATVVDKYRAQDIGVADASLVVLARRYETRKVLTLDHRHFDVLRPLQGKRFVVLP